jgi:hypothetical protein
MADDSTMAAAILAASVSQQIAKGITTDELPKKLVEFYLKVREELETQSKAKRRTLRVGDELARRLREGCASVNNRIPRSRLRFADSSFPPRDLKVRCQFGFGFIVSNTMRRPHGRTTGPSLH